MDDRIRIANLRIGTPFSGDNAPAVRYFLEDHLGNCSFTLESNGALFSREEYFPFGETSFGSFAKKRYRFCGKERDEESGLYYYGARYYAPWTCRFVSVDPMAGEYPFYTPYQYAGNKPVIAIDLDGLEEDPKSKTYFPEQMMGTVRADNTYQTSSKPRQTEMPSNSSALDLVNSNNQNISENKSNPLVISSPNNKPSEFNRELIVNANIGLGFASASAGVSEVFQSKLFQDYAEELANLFIKNGSTYKFKNLTGNFWIYDGRLTPYFVGNKILQVPKPPTFISKTTHEITTSILAAKRENFSINLRSTSSQISKTSNVLGKGLFFGSTALTIVDVIAYYTNGGDGVSKLGKGGLDIGMGAVGAYGGQYGALISAVYFTYDYLGWENCWVKGPKMIDQWNNSDTYSGIKNGNQPWRLQLKLGQ